MKIILSRKGFDSSAGGVASPIFADGSLLSLPIPDDQTHIHYADLNWQNRSLGVLVESLTRGRVQRHMSAHLDPDIYPEIYPRQPGWRPLFGQDGAAQSHLANQGVGVGDLFLFFGWFREVKRVGRGYRYLPNAPDQHVIYGWLQVDKILRADEIAMRTPPWAIQHPHCLGSRGIRNTLYIAADRLTLSTLTLPSAGDGMPLPGAGHFDSCHERHILTAQTAPRTRWRLPRWFYPAEGCPPLTYHADLRRWHVEDEWAYLQSAARGQEFVFDTTHYPEALAWVRTLFLA